MRRGKFLIVKIPLAQAEEAKWVADQLELDHGFYRGITQELHNRVDNMVYRIDMGNYGNHLLRCDVYAATLPAEWQRSTGPVKKCRKQDMNFPDSKNGPLYIKFTVDAGPLAIGGNLYQHDEDGNPRVCYY